MDKADYSDIRGYMAVLDNQVSDLRLFRGQTCDKPLLPKIARQNPRIDTTAKEKEMLAELRRRGALLIGKEITDDWELLVYAQHFGMATRLLDWTSNPLAALWFSCFDPDRSSAGYVYVLEVSDDLLLDRQTQRDPFSVRKTRVLKPNLNNVRIVAQGGWFTTHRYSRKGQRFVPLESNSDIKRRLVQIRVPGSAKSDALKQLDMLGVNSQSLFPDVEGLCKYVNWMHGV